MIVSRTHALGWGVALSALVAFGCTARFDEAGADTGGASSVSTAGAASSPGAGAAVGGSSNVQCTAPNPGTAPLRRLSNAEYRNSVSDLFAANPEVAALADSVTSAFPTEPESLGFHNSAQFLAVQTLTAQKYLDAAGAIAEKAAQTPGVVACTPAAGQELTCAKSFIADFGKRAYRRPLTDEESARYQDQFQRALSDYDFATGVEWTIFSMLQSPAFLYRVERGRDGNGATTRPTAYEMASRLSFLFWQSQPDATLLSLAESGQLETPAQIEQQARSMLADPRASRLFQYFSEWLDLDRLADFSRDPKVFADVPADLPSLYRQETQAFVDSVLSTPDGNLKQLLTAPYTYANQSLAAFYGLSPVTGQAFVRVDAPERAGVLTQALLMAQDKPYRTSIVRRGLKLRTDFLCQNIPAPPPNVPLDLDNDADALTQRQRLEQHRQVESCAVCHNQLDPIGIVFERFDAVGRYRAVDENGQSIDTSSVLTATQDADGPVADVRELALRLADSSEVQDCYVTQSFRFFFGREVEPADACSVQQLRQAFQRTDLNLSELLVALTQTDAFLYRPSLEAQP